MAELTEQIRLYEPHRRQPRIAAIGGGHGLSAMLRGLKAYTRDITAIVTVADDGGGSGMLREDLGMLPPGDIRNCIMALANPEPTMERLLNYRFTEGSLSGQSFGNLFLAAMNGISGSFDEAVQRMGEVLAITGSVLPVTNQNVYLEAEFDNGSRTLGESKIFYAKKINDCRIRQVRLVPEHPQALQDSIDAILQADDITALENLRVKYLGKKGELTAILKQMGRLSAEERPAMGQLANQVRAELEEALDQRREALNARMLEMRLKAETLDVTMPGKAPELGHQHPMYIVLDEIKDIFVGMGFEILEGPEIEEAEYNFTKLNTSEGHPAREWSDTFYLTEDSSILLRTQTSPMQVRAMESKPLPIRMVAPGRVYRKDEVDATHSPMFHQIEGMVIDKGVTMADLKGTLNTLVKKLYGENTVTRFRPHHFPFTEPSCEMDVQCHKCGGKGCPTCKGEGWIEILGAGMIHPKVLEGCGIDTDVYSGWAFGMGLERLAMRRFKISDLRLIFENDVRFLQQF